MTDDDEDPEVEEFHREVIEMVIRLCWARAYQLLADLRAEKELLDKAPPEEDEAEEKARLDERDKGKGKGKARAVVDSTWKLESRIGGRDENGGLLDKQGRVCMSYFVNALMERALKSSFYSLCARSRSRRRLQSRENNIRTTFSNQTTGFPQCQLTSTSRRKWREEISYQVEGALLFFFFLWRWAFF